MEKPKRPKNINSQEIKIPSNIRELIAMYDLDNLDIYDYLDKLVDELQDSGWNELSLSENITAYSSNTAYKPQYRKIGNIVYVAGCIKGVTSNNQILATLPEGYRPANQMRYITGRSGTANVVLQVNTAGEISFVCMSDNSTVSATTYIYIQTSFIAD